MPDLTGEREPLLIKLTRARIQGLSARSTRYRVADTEVRGLYLSVTPNGAKSFVFRSRIGKGREARQRDITIGNASQISVSEARDRALVLAATTRTGGDPATSPEEVLTVYELIRRYDRRLSVRKVVKRKDMISSLYRYLRSHRRRPVGELSLAQVVAVIDRLENEGRPGAASYFRKTVATMCRWAKGSGFVSENILSDYRRERATRAQILNVRRKVTFVSERQIAGFWEATELLQNETFGAFLRFLLLTGQRRTETALISREHIDGDTWKIPPEIRKMADAHSVPLSNVTKALIAQRSTASPSTLLFPGSHGGPMVGWSKLLRPVKDALGEPDFGMHALRRTYRTGLSDLGIPEHVAELMIGHKRNDLVAIYDRSDLWSRRVDAQRKWEEYIARICLGGS